MWCSQAEQGYGTAPTMHMWRNWHPPHDAFPYLVFLERVGVCPDQVPLRTREVTTGLALRGQKRPVRELTGGDMGACRAEPNKRHQPDRSDRKQPRKRDGCEQDRERERDRVTGSNVELRFGLAATKRELRHGQNTRPGTLVAEQAIETASARTP